MAAVTALVLLALGVPVASGVYWIFAGGAPSVTGGSVSMLNAAWHTAAYGVSAGVIDTLAALPVALLAIRHTSRARHFLERSTYLVLAMPGVVIGFALAYFTERYAAGAGYQTAPLLVICYAIMFFPLALTGVKAAIARAPASLDEMSRSLGLGRARDAAPGHPAAGRPRPGRRLLPGLPVGRHRADRHAAADPHGNADAGHPVLAVRDRRLLRSGRAVRAGHDRHCGRAELRAGPVLRPLR